MFILTLTRVLVLLAYAVPGFLLVKTKAIRPTSISVVATLLVYVCGPFQTFYSLLNATYTPELNKTLILCFVTVTVAMGAFLAIWYLITKKKSDDIRWRIFTVATTLGNVGFLGIPLLQNLLPDHPEALAISAVTQLSMNLIAWTFGLFIISRDKSYIRVKKILTVPNFIAFLIGYPIFVSGWQIPETVLSLITDIGKMATPLCMIVLGMRLATVKFRDLATDWRAVLAALAKMVLFPMLMLAITAPLPIEPYVRASMFVLGCCPCASMILNLAELRGEGQKTASHTVLIATLLCVITIPVMVALFYPA